MKKVVLILVSLLPFVYLALQFSNANDPIKYIYTLTGLSSMGFLFASLSITPLKKVINLMRYRKILGLFSLFYASLHFLNFVILDSELDIYLVLKETAEKPFIYLGTFAFLILLFMGITSTKQLFKKFNKWHKLVYIALILIVVHESMAQKVNGALEYFFIAFAIILLSFRIPRRMSSKRQTLVES